jgi:HD-like signal output (HDOD) protein/prolyl-tRNA editing enzyme YbaK/EbsC (Cys-tRNA(Pro) deacylase)
LPIPKVVTDQLAQLDIEFETIKLPNPMPLRQVAEFLGERASKLVRTIAVEEAGRQQLVVLPFTSVLDVKLFVGESLDSLDILLPEESQSWFSLSAEFSFPPIQKCCKARLVVDSSVLEMPSIIIESGSPTELIKLSSEAAHKLYDECESFSFAVTSERLFAGNNSKSNKQDVDSSFTPIRLKQRVDDTFDLPSMPEIAQDIMKLRVDPSADASRLAQIVKRDPSLAAQVISWASSPYYGYQGKIDSIETAIARVLGFELVMNLALGISIGKSLKVPMEGPLGVKEFWRQAIYCASLSEKLCRAMPIKQRPERGLIYLSGLLHNFGHLLLGHIFPPQFELVNKTILANPHIAVEDIEFYILGVTHEEIGAWLMQNWHMPDELIVAVHRHHQEEFWSKHAVYSNIVLVANRLLKRINIGDSVDTIIPESTLELLSIDEDVTDSALKDILLESESLDIMAKQLVA